MICELMWLFKMYNNSNNNNNNNGKVNNNDKISDWVLLLLLTTIIIKDSLTLYHDLDELWMNDCPMTWMFHNDVYPYYQLENLKQPYPLDRQDDDHDYMVVRVVHIYHSNRDHFPMLLDDVYDMNVYMDVYKPLYIKEY